MKIEMKELVAQGQWSENKFNINYSSILTSLIKEAAKCESYSSDLFIDWNSIEKSLKNKNLESKKYLFGFRDMGIDHEAFINCRGIENYRSVYQLNVDVNFPDIKMVLKKIR